MAMTPPHRAGKKLIFRRFRRDPHTGQLLDAYHYGKRAWPLWVEEDDASDE